MLTIVDYGVGNLNSILNMLKKGGTSARISGDDSAIAAASQLLLPGMGHFDNCMKKFNESGLRPTIEKKVFEDKTPLLGICVGLQMFMQSSEEGEEAGLGWINGRVLALNLKKWVILKYHIWAGKSCKIKSNPVYGRVWMIPGFILLIRIM